MLQKSRWKKWGHLSSFLPQLWSLNCAKKYIFCNFAIADLSKKPKSVIAIYINASESFIKVFQKMIRKGSEPLFKRY